MPLIILRVVVSEQCARRVQARLFVGEIRDQLEQTGLPWRQCAALQSALLTAHLAADSFTETEEVLLSMEAGVRAICTV